MTDEKILHEMIKDYATGKSVPDVGAEGNRQAVERHLVEKKGYDRSHLRIDLPLELTVAGAPYRSRVDLAVVVDGVCHIVFKCVAASLGSREREIVSAARLLYPEYQVPVAVSSDGDNAMVMNAISGKKIGEGMAAIPDLEAAMAAVRAFIPAPFPAERREREGLIFRTYDLENVNRAL